MIVFNVKEQRLLDRLHTEVRQAWRRGFVTGLCFGLAIGGGLLLVSGR